MYEEWRHAQWKRYVPMIFAAKQVYLGLDKTFGCQVDRPDLDFLPC